MDEPPLPRVFAGQRRTLLIRLILNGLVQAASIILTMLLLRHAFDVLLNPAFDDPEVHLYELSDVHQILLFATGLVGNTVLSAWLRRQERIDAERLGQAYVHRIRLRLYDHMALFSPRALSCRATGETTLRFVGDLSALRRWVSLGLGRIVVAVIVASGSLSFMGWLDPWLALGTTVLLVLGLLWNLRLGPRMHAAVAEARRRRGRLAGNINEKVRAFSVIQVFNQIPRERRRFSRQSRRLRNAMISRARASAHMRAVTDGAMACSMGLVLSLGALEVFYELTTAGNVVAAMAVVGFLSRSLQDLARVNEYHQSARVSRRKIQQFLRTQNLRGRSPELPDLQLRQGEIRFDRIQVPGALKRFSATIPGGCRVGIVGPNGSGKSTLLHLAARLLDPEKGLIYIDGQVIRRCNQASVRRAIGVVSPDLPLLRGTVDFNLRYRCPDATEEEVAQVVALCELQDLFEALPKGPLYRVQEAGQNLSLGQRHRLALARALLGHPRILLLDEIDANLDAQVAAVLDRVIDVYEGTLVMVSRNKVRLARMDQVWHLMDGRLAKIETPMSSAEPQAVNKEAE